MIFTIEDKLKVLRLLKKQDSKELVIRLFVSAMMQGTNITAPEMTNCTQIVINTLKETPERKEVKKQNQAV